MNRLKNIAFIFFCIAGTACTTVVGNMLDSLDGGPVTPNACASLSDGAACDDGDFCNGTDVCSSGLCVPTGSPAADGQTCLGGDTTQICVQGVCQTSACGDGVVSLENGEECDTADTSVGCTAACQHICEPDSDTCNTVQSPCDDNLECKDNFRCGVIVGETNPDGMACMSAGVSGVCQASECCTGEECI